MDEQANRLINQFKDGWTQVSDDQIAELIREARAEALAEAKTIVKEAMVQSILKHALNELGCSSDTTTFIGETAAPVPTAQEAAESKRQIRAEIAAIRGKIVENERLLNQVKAPPKQVAEEQTISRSAGDEAGDQSMEGEERCGYYVYGVVNSADGQLIEGLPGKGIDPAYPVYALSCAENRGHSIQAIVSKVSLQEFGQESLEANLDDMQWLQAKVYAHQNVLETVLNRFTLVPMRFCTIYRSERRVREMLARHYDDLVDALGYLEGKQEWGVKAYCDEKNLAQRVEGVSERTQELKAEMAQKSSGAAYFMKKKLDEIVVEEVERISGEYAQRSHDRLSNHAQEVVINSLQGKELTRREGVMILNGAYLVAKDQLAAFRAELDSLKGEYGDLGFSYELTGPWTPYNFVTIHLGERAVND
jgi:hypothetical protein